MARVRLFLLGFGCLVYLVSRAAPVSARMADDLPARASESAEQERELLGVLQEVLEKLQNKRLVTWEKKLSRLPRCNLGDSCSVKKGARFGKLCDCPSGAKCNYFFLKCL
ncbi:cocaine- and amphetamine-regulated transcript protein-like [Amia ocellicauda]|uniref:cocaine- and amphetamine-regulated transcript protein-like n=1 Tax=Amia ocellicauda TaxID=2972642 RepID=UPI003464DEDE